jgi:uncharacterized protein YkwD
MRWSTLSLCLVACGPIYPDPPKPAPQSQAQTQPQYQSGPPGGAADPTPPPGPPAQPVITREPPPLQAPPPSGPTSPQLPVLTNAPPAMRALVDLHNEVRAKHCAAPLSWSPKLAAVAQDWANSLKAQGCKFGHKPRNTFGENLAAGTTGALDGESVARMWYDEVKLYNFSRGGFSMETGHFTQVVWKQTTQIGCAVTSCNGMDIWVCEYNPAGNVETLYKQNVMPTGCR